MAGEPVAVVTSKDGTKTIRLPILHIAGDATGVFPCRGCVHTLGYEDRVAGVIYTSTRDADLPGLGTYCCSIGYTDCNTCRIVRETRGFRVNLSS